MNASNCNVMTAASFIALSWFHQRILENTSGNVRQYTGLFRSTSMPEVVTVAEENREQPTSKPLVGIIYPPPEVRSILYVNAAAHYSNIVVSVFSVFFRFVRMWECWLCRDVTFTHLHVCFSIARGHFAAVCLLIKCACSLSWATLQFHFGWMGWIIGLNYGCVVCLTLYIITELEKRSWNLNFY